MISIPAQATIAHQVKAMKREPRIKPDRPEAAQHSRRSWASVYPSAFAGSPDRRQALDCHAAVVRFCPSPCGLPLLAKCCQVNRLRATACTLSSSHHNCLKQQQLNRKLKLALPRVANLQWRPF